MKSPPRILFLEDNPYFIEALMDEFRSLSWPVTHITNIREAKEHFSNEEFDLVISDLHLQDIETGAPNSGLDFIHYIRQRKKSKVPIIVTTGLELISEESIVENEVDLFFYKSELDLKKFISSIKNLINQS